VLVRDFFFYWYHRSLHSSPFLWQLHKLHHMDRELNVLTAARENWIDPFLEALLVALPVTLLFKLDNTSPLIIGAIPGFIIAFLHGNQGTFIHFNVKLRLGWASVLWCGPQVHRIHHSRLLQHQDKNFAAAFPLWDVLFGTYYAPARDEFPPTGVDGEPEIQHLAEAQIFALREWRKMLRARRRRTAILA
jgi:sterol desaturase/sphingolipid hydroxylase (fatty acid hydroxylase superfamily)